MSSNVKRLHYLMRGVARALKLQLDISTRTTFMKDGGLVRADTKSSSESVRAPGKPCAHLLAE